MGPNNKLYLFLILILLSSIVLGCSKSVHSSSDSMYTKFSMHMLNSNGTEALSSATQLYIYAQDDNMDTAVTIFDGSKDSVYASSYVSGNRGYSYLPGEDGYPKEKVVTFLNGKYLLEVPIIYNVNTEISNLPNGSHGIHTIYFKLANKNIPIRGDFYWYGSNTNFGIDSVYMDKRFFMRIDNSDFNVYDSTTETYNYTIPQ